LYPWYMNYCVATRCVAIRSEPFDRLRANG
jgi:hypothetical protein